MNENHIDYSSALVKNDCSINTVMIGFGNTNKQIFLTSVANNQFVSLDENNNVVLKPINYHIFDKANLENDKNLNFNYYRFKNEFKVIEVDEYLPLPQIPANEHFYKMDVNDKMFYREEGRQGSYAGVVATETSGFTLSPTETPRSFAVSPYSSQPFVPLMQCGTGRCLPSVVSR